MDYKDFGLKINEEKTTIQLKNGIKFNVLKYLPIEDKIDLIQIALQKSQQNGIYNEMKLDMYFHLYLVYMYTDIDFSEEDKEDEYKLYNELESNEIINYVVESIEDDEYNKLLEYLSEMQTNKMMYKTSAAAIVDSLVQDLPKNAQAAADIVNNFDKEKYQNVVDFVKSANADRPV